MNSFDTWFQRELTRRIAEEIESKAAAIVSGAVSDMADYKGRTEYIRALKHALEWCEEIAEKVSGRDERGK